VLAGQTNDVRSQVQTVVRLISSVAGLGLPKVEIFFAKQCAIFDKKKLEN
jgi:hypothetical protein